MKNSKKSFEIKDKKNKNSMIHIVQQDGLTTFTSIYRGRTLSIVETDKELNIERRPKGKSTLVNNG